MVEVGRRYYFAYGSNLDELQMKGRCPNAVIESVAKLSGYRFIINSRGVATIIPESSKNVYGVVWIISETDEVSLDEREGVSGGYYYKEKFDVELHGRKTLNCMVYVARNNTPGSSKNNRDYMKRIVIAAEHHGLPSKYLAELKLWL